MYRTWVLAIIFVMALSGCASMGSSGSYQSTLIRTSPPGASIYVGGQKVGRSPDYVDVRRSRKPVIALETREGMEEYELPTRYRWNYFWRNFGFLIYAPIGWVVDLATGSAWNIRDPEVIPVQLSEKDSKTPKIARTKSVIVIAPPQSASIAMSDTAGIALEEKLRTLNPGANVRPYKQTLPFFLNEGYEYGSLDSSLRRNILKKLDADIMYEAQVESETGASWQVSSQAREFGKDDLLRPGPTVSLDRDDSPRVLGLNLWSHPWWSRVMPNTIGVDFVNEQINIQFNDAKYDLAPVHGEEWWTTGLRYLSAINISSTPDRRREYGSRWEFGAVPSFRFSRKTLKLTGLPPGSTFMEREPQFTRWSVAGGYGLELGYLMRRHYIYFDIIPMFNWGQISWRQAEADYQATRTGITALFEIGYSYIFESNWVFRAFSRSQSENTELWADAVRSRIGQTYVPTSSSAVVSGISIAYRFETDKFRAR